MNNDLRLKIVQMVVRSGEGHIPSSFSIVDLIDYIYGKMWSFNRFSEIISKIEREIEKGVSESLKIG